LPKSASETSISTPELFLPPDPDEPEDELDDDDEEPEEESVPAACEIALMMASFMACAVRAPF